MDDGLNIIGLIAGGLCMIPFRDQQAPIRHSPDAPPTLELPRALEMTGLQTLRITREPSQVLPYSTSVATGLANRIPVARSTLSRTSRSLQTAMKRTPSPSIFPSLVVIIPSVSRISRFLRLKISRTPGPEISQRLATYIVSHDLKRIIYSLSDGY
jgi:hypothetical protein